MTNAGARRVSAIADHSRTSHSGQQRIGYFCRCLQGSHLACSPERDKQRENVPGATSAYCCADRTVGSKELYSPC